LISGGQKKCVGGVERLEREGGDIIKVNGGDDDGSHRRSAKNFSESVNKITAVNVVVLQALRYRLLSALTHEPLIVLKTQSLHYTTFISTPAYSLYIPLLFIGFYYWKL